MKLKRLLEDNSLTKGLYKFKIDSNSDNIKAYHGTDLQISTGTTFKLPMWITSYFGLASHFALNPASSSKTVNTGFVYLLEIIDPKVKKQGTDRYILSSGQIKILEVIQVKRDPIVFAKIISRKKL